MSLPHPPPPIPWRLLLALTLAVGALSPWFEGLRSPNETTRIYLTEALLVDGSLRIDGPIARHGPVADVAVREGHAYCDKAPGASLVALPAVALYRALSPAPSLAGQVRAGRIAASALPTLLILVGLWLWLRTQLTARILRGLLVAYALGSLASPYGSLLFGHQLAAACLLHAWLQARRLRPEAGAADPGSAGSDSPAPGRERPPWAAVRCGLWAGAAVLAEYPSALVGLPIGLAVLSWSRRRPAQLAWAALGVLPAAALLLSYHQAAFGHPLHTGYQYLTNPYFARLHGEGLFGLGWPRFGRLRFHLLSARKGLVFFAPWLALALPGLRRLWRHPDGPVSLGVIGLSLLLLLCMPYDNGGWTLGQRHLTGVVPWLLLPVGLALERWPRLEPLAVAGALVGVTLSHLGAAVLPYYPEHARNPSVQYGLAFARAGVDGGGLWPALGLPSLWGAAAVGLLAGIGLLRGLRQAPARLLAVALAATTLAGISQIARDQPIEARREALRARISPPP